MTYRIKLNKSHSRFLDKYGTNAQVLSSRPARSLRRSPYCMKIRVPLQFNLLAITFQSVILLRKKTSLVITVDSVRNVGNNCPKKKKARATSNIKHQPQPQTAISNGPQSAISNSNIEHATLCFTCNNGQGLHSGSHCL